MSKETFVDGWKLAKILWYVDTGFQKYMWKGKESFSRKVSLTFELDELMSDGRPFVHTEEFTFNNKRKSQSAKDFCVFLETITNHSFDTEEEINSFEFDSLPGTTLAINFEVVLYTRKDGTKTTYPKILEYRKPREGVEYTFESENEHIFFNLMNPNVDEYKKVPGWIRKKIRESASWDRVEDHVKSEIEAFDDEVGLYANFNKSKSNATAAKKAEAPTKNQFSEPDSVFAEEDDCPF